MFTGTVGLTVHRDVVQAMIVTRTTCVRQRQRVPERWRRGSCEDPRICFRNELLLNRLYRFESAGRGTFSIQNRGMWSHTMVRSLRHRALHDRLYRGAQDVRSSLRTHGAAHRSRSLRGVNHVVRPPVSNVRRQSARSSTLFLGTKAPATRLFADRVGPPGLPSSWLPRTHT